MPTNTTCNPYYYKDGVKYRYTDEQLHQQRVLAEIRKTKDEFLAELRRVKGE